MELMNKRQWGINNDRIRGSYIDHFECLVCKRLHANQELRSKNQSIIHYKTKKEAYGIFFLFRILNSDVVYFINYIVRLPAAVYI